MTNPTKFHKYLEPLEKDGFVVIPDLIPSADLNELQSALASLIELKGYGDRPHEKFGDQLPLDHVLHSGMIQATNNPTKDSNFIYNAIDMTPANMRLLMGEKILEAASILVGAEHRHHVLLNNMNVRIDIPTGKQLIGWHQDYHYLFHDTEPNKTVSAWIPLETCEKENGALEVAVGSHKRGLLKTKSVDKKDSNRDDYLVESDLLAGLTTCQVGVPRGSVLFLHINIAHRSGVNSSQRVRYTTLARYNNAQLMKCLDDYHRPKYPVPK